MGQAYSPHSQMTAVSVLALQSGILGGYAVVGANWAVGMGNGTLVGAYADYITSGLPASGTTTGNYSIGSNPATLVGNLQVNSLKITGGTTMNLGGHTLSIASGGLMFTGSSYSVSNGQLGANGAELIIWQNASGTVTVSGPIGNSNSALTVAGTSTLEVTSTIPNTVYLDRAAGISGTLDMAPSSNYVYSGTIVGVGTLVKGGSNMLTLSGQNNVGTVTTNAGILVIPQGATLTASAELNVGYVGNGGTLNVSGGTVTCGSNGVTSTFLVGFDNGTGILTMSGGSLTTQAFQIGTYGGTATVNVSGGSLSLGYWHMDVSSGTANVDITGGNVNASYMGIGNTSTTINLSGGVVDIGSTVFVTATNGVINVSGGSLILESGASIGGSSGSANTINLSGGTLNVGSGLSGAGSGVSTITFDGGTLQARNSSTSFLQGFEYAYVRSSGMAIDTNGNDVTIAAKSYRGSVVNRWRLTEGWNGNASVSWLKHLHRHDHGQRRHAAVRQGDLALQQPVGRKLVCHEYHRRVGRTRRRLTWAAPVSLRPRT